ncbi:hypothetical protein Tco_1447381 [Tanacetum coccineum]
MVAAHNDGYDDDNREMEVGMAVAVVIRSGGDDSGGRRRLGDGGDEVVTVAVAVAWWWGAGCRWSLVGDMCNEYSQNDKSKANKDKTEHETGRASENKAEYVFSFNGPTRYAGDPEVSYWLKGRGGDLRDQRTIWSLLLIKGVD